jgi:hypothetical protein
MIVGAYTPAEFAKLMREGIPKDGKERELMTRTARNRFAHFTNDEVNALYTYLAGKSPTTN